LTCNQRLLTYRGKTMINAVTKTMSQIPGCFRIVRYVLLNYFDLGMICASHSVKGSIEMEKTAQQVRYVPQLRVFITTWK